MNTVQLLFRTRTVNDDDESLDKVQNYLAALLQNGQIVGDHTMARVSDGYLVTTGLPEDDALRDRFTNKWVRKHVRELATLESTRRR